MITLHYNVAFTHSALYNVKLSCTALYNVAFTHSALYNVKLSCTALYSVYTQCTLQCFAMDDLSENWLQLDTSWERLTNARSLTIGNQLCHNWWQCGATKRINFRCICEQKYTMEKGTFNWKHVWLNTFWIRLMSKEKARVSNYLLTL